MISDQSYTSRNYVNRSAENRLHSRLSPNTPQFLFISAAPHGASFVSPDKRWGIVTTLKRLFGQNAQIHFKDHASVLKGHEAWSMAAMMQVPRKRNFMMPTCWLSGTIIGSHDDVAADEIHLRCTFHCRHGPSFAPILGARMVFNTASGHSTRSASTMQLPPVIIRWVPVSTRGHTNRLQPTFQRAMR